MHKLLFVFVLVALLVVPAFAPDDMIEETVVVIKLSDLGIAFGAVDA